MSVAVTAGLPYTQTVRVGAGDYGALVILFNANGFHPGTWNPSVTFDVSTGTLLAPATVESYGSRYLGRGIWEFWATYTAVATTASFFQPLRLTTARPPAPGQHLIIYSVQLEQASSPGSYIKTEASSVTRPAGSVTMSDTSWFNLNEGTVVVAAETLPFMGNQQRRAFAIGPSSATRLTVRYDGLSGVSSTIGIDGAIQCDMRSVVPLGPRLVSVFGHRKDDFAVSCDGAQLVTDTSGDVLPAAGQVYLAGIVVFPRRLSAAELRWSGFFHRWPSTRNRSSAVPAAGMCRAG